ncbi:MAG: fibronectin type III domain-containing protein [Pseudomonadota bacterium]
MKRIFGFQIVSSKSYSIKFFCLALIGLICFFPSVVFSYDIALSWDSSQDSDIDGYKVFIRADGQDYDYLTPVFKGSGSSCTITGLDYDVQYFFVARSYREMDSEAIDSDNSNEIGYLRTAPALVEEPSTDETEQDSGVVENPAPETENDMEDTSGEGSQDVITDNKTSDDGSLLIKNMASYQPVLTSPENGMALSSVAPILNVQAYQDSSTDNVHSATEWQISKNIDFSSIVLKQKSESALTSLIVPQLILDGNTAYFWRVRFFDYTNTGSEWSDSWKFTTTMSYIEDENLNGVPDDLEVDGNVDLDNNGIADIHQDDIKCMNTTDGKTQVGVGIESGEGTIDMIQSIDWDLIGDSENRPKKMPMNLIGFRLLVETGAEVEVVIYFSEKLPKNAKWFKHDVQNGWQDFSEHTVFSTTEDDRTKVTFYLTDGGFGDEDGMANGVIIDPSGPGYISLGETATDVTGDDAGLSDAGADSGGGCFIGTGVSHHTAASLPSSLFSGFLFLAALAGLVRFNRK